MGLNNTVNANDLNQTKKLARLSLVSRFSERHSRRLIKRETGKTPLQMLRIKQLRTAEQLLVNTVLPITDIAFCSEFSSVRQFNNAFKQFYGINPRQLRQSLSTSVRTA